MRKSWTSAEDQFLRDNYGLLPPADIATHIERSHGTVIWRAGVLGLREPKNPLWTDAENKFLRDSYPSMPIKEICAHLGRSYVAVQHQAERNGISKIGNPGSSWTEDEDELLDDLYGTIALDRITELLGRSSRAVVHRAMRRGVNKRWREPRLPEPREVTVSTMRRDSICHNYFAQVDSSVKAYILGWLASDGNVKSEGNSIRLRINVKDEEILHLVQKELAPLHRVTYYQSRCPSGKMSSMGRFEVISEQMKQDLIKLGVTPNKSLTLQYPSIAPHLDGSFILGYFEGDGSIFQTNRRWRWTITCASPPLLVTIQDRIEDAVGIRPRGPHRHNRPNRAYQITLNGSNIGPVDAWLHAEVDGLARKRLPASTTPTPITPPQ